MKQGCSLCRNISSIGPHWVAWVFEMIYRLIANYFSFKNLFMETKPSEMTTLTAVLEKLRHQHNDNEFTISENGFTTTNGKFYKPEDLTIIKTYRFEGPSDPADSSIVY